MKKFVFMLAVLEIANVANAALLLSVDGVVDPPESEITLLESETVIIDIYSDGQTMGEGTWLSVEGPGTITSVPNGVNHVNTYYGIFDVYGMVFIDLAQLIAPPVPPLPEGTLVDGIIFHCTGIGDVTLTLTNEAGDIVYDTQVIHQDVPEPVSIALLGLGGLFLRRRK